eukprot:GHVS01085311.1.p1 GENE.GHVS01085311.1~~GHVS01085311.1.p1  ORF type:complete len:101 (-),score=0.15 GHVS01085311.1:119-421(-)
MCTCNVLQHNVRMYMLCISAIPKKPTPPLFVSCPHMSLCASCSHVHVYMCTCVHAYMCTCVHVYMCTCVHVYMRTCILDEQRQHEASTDHTHQVVHTHST